MTTQTTSRELKNDGFAGFVKSFRRAFGGPARREARPAVTLESLEPRLMYSAAAADLTAYAPAGWSNKIVVSCRANTHTDDSPIRTDQNVLVDFGIVNQGAASTANRFYTNLYLDGTFKKQWYTNGLTKNYYTEVDDYSLGMLSAGNHSVKIVIDTTSAVREGNESNNSYTRWFTVTPPPKGDLAASRPNGWSDAIVISNRTGTTSDVVVNSGDTLYVDWAITNQSNGNANGKFYTNLYVDGVYRNQWYTNSLKAGAGANVTDYCIGKLAAGNHTITIITDSTNVIPEVNESNNGYTKSFKVVAADWFSQNLLDSAICTLARQLDADGSLSRGDMVSLLRLSQSDNYVSANELHDYRTLLSSWQAMRMTDYVHIVADHIVNGSAANGMYQGQALGNLAVGSSGAQMEKLINKWFFGTDRPGSNYSVNDGKTFLTSTYRQVSGSLFVNGVSYTDIRQGSLGDCYFLASLAEVAARSPSVITSGMFVDNGDGTYGVRFFHGGTVDFVTVDRMLPTDSSGALVFANRGTAWNNSANELWVELAEKAYVQMCETGLMEGRGSSNTYWNINGGWPFNAIRQITNIAQSHTSMDYAGITSAFSGGRLIALNAELSSGGKYIGLHSLALVGFNSQSGVFTIYNPWGSAATFTWSEMTTGKTVGSYMFRFTTQDVASKAAAPTASEPKVLQDGLKGESSLAFVREALLRVQRELL